MIQGQGQDPRPRSSEVKAIQCIDIYGICPMVITTMVKVIQGHRHQRSSLSEVEVIFIQSLVHSRSYGVQIQGQGHPRS